MFVETQLVANPNDRERSTDGLVAVAQWKLDVRTVSMTEVKRELAAGRWKHEVRLFFYSYRL